MAVRQAAGVFDVSHMCIVDLHGARARELLAQLLANDIGRLTRRRARRSTAACSMSRAASSMT